MSTDQVFVGLGLLLALAVGCQLVAERLRIPAIVLLLPVGFAAGQWTDSVRPQALFGDSFAPMVGLAVAVILFEGGLNLRVRDLESHSQRVVRRLVSRGVVITWVASALLAAALFPISADTATLLGAILIVSGPTVVAPLLRVVEPGRRLTAILEWESTTVDPIGAILAAITYQVIHTGAWLRPGRDLVMLFGSVGVGVAGAAVGFGLLWLLLERLQVSGVLATEATIAVVVFVAAVCNAIRDDTGLIAAIGMGVAITNTQMLRSPEDRPFFRTIVELMIGLLFISISATVTAASIREVLWPALALTAALIIVVRPLVTLVATHGSDLTRSERLFIALDGSPGNRGGVDRGHARAPVVR